jgi:hypothetical protein
MSKGLYSSMKTGTERLAVSTLSSASGIPGYELEFAL